MGGRTGRVIGVVVAVGVAITGVIGAASMSASGEEPPEATDPVYDALGTLTITLTDRDGNVVLDYDDPSVDDVEQAIVTQQPCAQIGFGPLAGGDLLAITPIVGGATTAEDTAQLRDGALGVNTGTSCGNRQAGLIGPDELLEVALGSFIDPDPSAPTVFARRAEVVLDKDFANDGDATVGIDGGSQGAPIPVARGGDTIVIQPDDPFLSVTLGSTSTKDSRGLAVGGPTFFELVTLSDEFEVAVDCGEQVTRDGLPGQIAVRATFLRAENGNGGSDKSEGDCVDVGVTVEIEDESVFWVNSGFGVDGSVQDVSGLVTIEWSGVAASGSPGDVDAALDREIAYDGVSFTDLLWCESFSRSVDPATGAITFTATQPKVPAGTPGAIVVDGVPSAPWCLVEDQRELVDGEIFQLQMLFGNGDPRMR